MKFTSEELLQSMGLAVGDRVKLSEGYYTFIFDVKLNKYNKPYLSDGEKQSKEITILLDHDFEILPRPKRVGELKCSDDDTLNCSKCPLFVFCHASREYDNKRLYDVLDDWFKCSKDQEIYDLLKKRLDKEVVEE